MLRVLTPACNGLTTFEFSHRSYRKARQQPLCDGAHYRSCVLATSIGQNVITLGSVAK